MYVITFPTSTKFACMMHLDLLMNLKDLDAESGRHEFYMQEEVKEFRAG